MTGAQAGEYRYEGGELEVFAQARNWKQYWAALIAPYLNGDVLEVGAGTGSNTEFLRPLCRGRYVSLEPDSALVSEAKRKLGVSTAGTEFLVGTVESLKPDAMFDCALYIDVLEHIENDAGELARAARHIRPGGHIVVLSPAHNLLYSPFDRAIGHYRRYSRTSLLRCTPAGTEVRRAVYLDSIGGLLSLANRALLRASCPTQSQILFWDRVVIPVSRYVDALFGFRVGKSILAVWRAQERTFRK